MWLQLTVEDHLGAKAQIQAWVCITNFNFNFNPIFPSHFLSSIILSRFVHYLTSEKRKYTVGTHLCLSLHLWDFFVFYINLWTVYFYHSLTPLDEPITFYSVVSKHDLTTLRWWPVLITKKDMEYHFIWDVSGSICTGNTWERSWQNSLHVYIFNG